MRERRRAQRSRGGDRAAATAAAQPDGRPRLNRRLLVAFAVFALCLVAYYALTALPWFREGVFPAYLRINAAVSARLLGLLGEDVTINDTVILTPRFALEIKRGCDAIEPSALFAAAVLAFPAAWGRRLIGLALGVPALLALNLVRIVSLYYTGVHAPDAFAAVHVEVWQPLFIAAALLLWVAWALWATRKAGAGGGP